jgi:hypothetical protein
MTKGYVKLLALITTFLFTTNVTVFAAPHKVYKIRVPEEIGQVKERYEGTSDEVVIHIQDAHTSFEVQENVAKLIEHLVVAENLSTVTTESAEGYLDYSFIRDLPGGVAKNKVLRQFLKEGRFTGTEYAQLTSPKSFDLYGAESMELYMKNHEAFVSTISKREEILAQIEQVESILNDLKSPLFSDAVASFDKDLSAYASGDLSFFEYCGKLLMYASKANVDISEYVNFTMLLEAKSWEQMIDFEKVDSERNATIQAVTAALTMANDSLSIKKKDIFTRQLASFEQTENKKGTETTEFYTLLKNLAVEKRIDQEQIQNFINFSNYISIFSRLDKSGLLIECKELQRAIEDRLATNSDEKELIHLTRNIQLLKDIVELTVVPEDIDYYSANKEKFAAAVFKAFLEKNGHADANVAALDQILPSVDVFYSLAEERSILMAEEAVNRMQERNESVVSLVAGGFHTGGITKEFKNKGISYIVVTPQINEVVTDVPYVDQMMGSKMPFQMMIESAMNTLMQMAKAMLSKQGQDIIGLEVAKNTIVAISQDAGSIDVNEFMANNELSAEWSKLRAAMYQHFAKLGIDSYSWTDYVPSQQITFKGHEVATIRVETVNNRAPQYTVYYKDLTPPEVISATIFDTEFKERVAPAQISQSDEADIVTATVNDLINTRYQETFTALGIDPFDAANNSIEQNLQALNPVLRKGDFGLMHVQGDTLPEKAAQKIDTIKKRSRMIPQASVMSSIAPAPKVAVRVDQNATPEQAAATISSLKRVAPLVQAVNDALPNGVQVEILPQSFASELQALDFDTIEGNLFRYSDIVLYHEPAVDGQPAIVNIVIDDFLALAEAPDKTRNIVDRQTGETQAVSNKELLMDAIKHEVAEALNPLKSGDNVQQHEEINRFNNPVADAGAVLTFERITSSLTAAATGLVDSLEVLYTSAVSGLIELQESTFKKREAVTPTSSVFALYLDADYIAMSEQYNEDELIRPLITNIQAASPQKIILGFEDESMLQVGFIKNLIAAVEKTNIQYAIEASATGSVNKTERFVNAVAVADFSNKVVVTKNQDVISADVKGTAGKHVVKIDFNVMIDQSSVSVLPATFAAMNALVFLNKANEAEFKDTDLLVRDQVRMSQMPEAGYIYGFSSKVTDALAQQGIDGVFKVVSGLMKAISARVAEQRVYEKTIEIAA